MFVLIMASKHNLDLFCCQPVFVDPKTVRSISSGSATNSDIGFISLRLRFFVARRQRRLRPQISVLIGSEFEKIPLAIWLESVSTVFIPFDTSFCIARETGFFLFGPSGLDGAIRGRCVRVVMRGCPYTSAIDSVWPFFFNLHDSVLPPPSLPNAREWRWPTVNCCMAMIFASLEGQPTCHTLRQQKTLRKHHTDVVAHRVQCLGGWWKAIGAEIRVFHAENQNFQWRKGQRPSEVNGTVC